MHNIKEIRKNLDFFKKKIKDRNSNINFDKLIDFDKNNRELINKKENLEKKKKDLSKLKDKKNFELSKNLSKEIEEISKNQSVLQREIDKIIHNIPNLALEDVPIGDNEKSNKLIKQIGKIKKFNFDIKHHSELGEKNNNMDFDLSRKLSGARFVVLKDKLALLERALINFMLDIHIKKFGYLEIFSYIM